MKSTKLPITCDGCGKPIEDIGDALVEWIENDGRISDARVVHIQGSNAEMSCYKHTSNYHRSDLNLDQVIVNTELMKRLGLY